MNTLLLPPDAFRAIHLPGGATATLRPVAPSDLAAERDFVAGLSPQSRFYRFHGAVNGLTDAMARYLTCVDQQRHVAIVATISENGHETVIADARYVASDDTAEFAIAVADRYQGCGVARRLLDALAACARRSGLRWLVGEVLAGNRPMLALAEHLGFIRATRAADAGVVRVERSVAPLAVAEEGLVARACSRIRKLFSRPQAANARQAFAPF
jgi:acetyltransferase